MTKDNFITFSLVGLFFGFMGQVTLGAAFSGNYLFIIFPLLFLLKDQKIKVLPGDIKIVFYIYCFIFFIAWVLQ